MLIRDRVIDPEVYAKFADINVGISDLGFGVLAVANALGSDDPIVEARLKCFALMERKQEVAADVAILKEMLGVR
jgi:hypothetical protein